MLKPNTDIAKTLGLNNAQPKPMRKILMASLGLIGVIASAVLVLNPQQQPDIVYTTEPVSRGEITLTVSATGTLAPVKEVEVGIEVSGTIKTVLVDYNDQVKVGQVLAVLDTTRLNAQALQSEASLVSAKAKVQQIQASLQEAKIKMSRLSKALELSGGKVPSQYEMDTAKATLAKAIADEASAKASVAQAQAMLDVNRTDLTKAVVRSPINGVVLKRTVEPGQTVASTFQAPVLFTLAEDLTQMELQVDVDEADVGKVKEQQLAEFTVDAYPERSFPAQITQVRYGAETVEGVVTYKTVLKVDNKALELRPGMTATATITVLKKTNVLQIPNSVLRYQPSEQLSVQQTQKSINLVSMLLPKPPVERSGRPKTLDTTVVQDVWVLIDGQPVKKSIVKGISNNAMTELVGGEVSENMLLISASRVTP